MASTPTPSPPLRQAQTSPEVVSDTQFSVESWLLQELCEGHYFFGVDVVHPKSHWIGSSFFNGIYSNTSWQAQTSRSTIWHFAEQHRRNPINEIVDTNSVRWMQTCPLFIFLIIFHSAQNTSEHLTMTDLLHQLNSSAKNLHLHCNWTNAALNCPFPCNSLQSLFLHAICLYFFHSYLNTFFP